MPNGTINTILWLWSAWIGIATGTRGKEPSRHGQLLLEQADRQERCHRLLRLWLPWHHKGLQRSRWQWEGEEQWNMQQEFVSISLVHVSINSRWKFLIDVIHSGVHDLDQGQHLEPKMEWKISCHRLPSGKLANRVLQSKKTLQIFDQNYNKKNFLLRHRNWGWMWRTRTMQGVRCFLCSTFKLTSEIAETLNLFFSKGWFKDSRRELLPWLPFQTNIRVLCVTAFTKRIAGDW